jgi:hypothetical protein
VQGFTGSTTAWTACSITSRYGDEVRLERKEASGVAGVLDLLCNRTITMNQKVRQGERGEMVQKRGRRVLHCTGIRRRFACSSEDSGEKFRQPGGISGEIGRGETERRGSALYRHGLGSKRQGFNREMKRRDYGEVTVVGVGFGPGKKKMMWPGSGVHSSARERPAQRTGSE